MLERDIEAHLVSLCKEWHILCEKFTSPSRRSVPDRMLTYRTVAFLELKATGKRPTAAQERDHERRREHGADVFWTDSKEGVETFVLNFMIGRAPFMAFDDTFKVIPRGA